MQANIRKTAYHEAGHALVAHFTPGADPLHKATINHRGGALGLTWQTLPVDEYSRTLTQMLASIDVCMGGTVAEKIVFGDDMVSTGATGDLESATATAQHLVTACGLSEAVGPVAVSSASSPEQRALADREVRPSVFALQRSQGSVPFSNIQRRQMLRRWR